MGARCCMRASCVSVVLRECRLCGSEMLHPCPIQGSVCICVSLAGTLTFGARLLTPTTKKEAAPRRFFFQLLLIEPVPICTGSEKRLCCPPSIP
jgi:hypothetical protein